MKPTSSTQATTTDRFLLWVDGVGGYLLCCGGQLSVGGPGTADLTLQAGLSRQHLVLADDEETWWVTAQRDVDIVGKDRCPAGQRKPLPDDCELRLNQVRLKFQRPNPLSRTVVLTPERTHRPVLGVDGCVVMPRDCLLGPDPRAHIPCADWPRDVLLFRRDGQFWCRAPRRADVGGPVQPGEIVEGDGFRFRLEEVA